MSQRKKIRKKLQVSDLPSHLQHVNLNAAGIDIGSDRHLVAVPEGRDEDNSSNDKVSVALVPSRDWFVT